MYMSNNRRRNALVVPGADDAINKFKNEIAAELGIADYDKIDKGALPARLHGMVGGTMTKRLIEMGQLYINGQDPSSTQLHTDEYAEQARDEIARTTQAALEAAASIMPEELH